MAIVIDDRLIDDDDAWWRPVRLSGKETRTLSAAAAQIGMPFFSSQTWPS